MLSQIERQNASLQQAHDAFHTERPADRGAGVQDQQAGGGGKGGAFPPIGTPLGGGWGGLMDIRARLFISTTAKTGSGGAAANGIGSMIVSDSRFVSNTAVSGGALAASDGNETVLRSVFESNAASMSGGAIDIGPFGLVLKDSLFIRNQSASPGGAVWGVRGGDNTRSHATPHGGHSTPLTNHTPGPPPKSGAGGRAGAAGLLDLPKGDAEHPKCCTLDRRYNSSDCRVPIREILEDHVLFSRVDYGATDLVDQRRPSSPLS